MRRLALSLALVASACALDEAGLGQDASTDVGVDVITNDATPSDVTSIDAPADVILDVPPDVPLPPACNPTSPFGSIVDLGGGVDTSAFESSPSLTTNELAIFFARDTGSGRLGLFYATRPGTAQAFGAATEVGTVSSGTTIDTAPFIVDGMNALYFASVRGGSSSHYHLYAASGNGTPDGWSGITLLTALDSFDPAADSQPWIVGATSEIWFASDRAGSLDLYYSPNITSPPTFALALATSGEENHPTLSYDGLTIFFGRVPNGNQVHVMTATRPTTVATFGTTTLVNDFESGNSSNTPGWLSKDGCRMYFTSDRGGGKGSSDIWLATRGS